MINLSRLADKKSIAIIVSVSVIFILILAVLFFRRRSNWLVTDTSTTDTTILSYQTNIKTCDQAYSLNKSSGMSEADATSIRTRCYLAAANTLVTGKCTYTDVSNFDALEGGSNSDYATLKSDATWIASAYDPLINEFNGIAPSAVTGRNVVSGSPDINLFRRSVTIPNGTIHTFGGVSVNISNVVIYRTDILAARAADISGPTRKFFTNVNMDCSNIFTPAETNVPDRIDINGQAQSSSTTANNYTTVFRSWAQNSSYFDSTRLELKDTGTGASLTTTSGSITYVTDANLVNTKAIRNIAAWKVLSLDFTVPTAGITVFPNESMTNYSGGTALSVTTLNNVTYPAETINGVTVSPVLTGTANTKLAGRVGNYDGQNISNADKALMYGPGSVIPTSGNPVMSNFVAPSTGTADTNTLYAMASVSKDIFNMLTALQRPTTGYSSTVADALS